MAENTPFLGNSTESTIFDARRVSFILFETCIMIIIVFGNVLVVAAVLKFPRLRTATNLLVVNLASADLLQGAITLPLHILLFAQPHLTRHFVLCMLRYCIILTSSGASAIFLMWISAERFVAIHYPYSYQRIINNKLISKSLQLLTWIYCVTISFLPLFGWNTWAPGMKCKYPYVLPIAFTAFIIVHTHASALIIAILYFMIFLTANRQAKEIAKQRSIQQRLQSDSSTIQNKESVLMKNTKAARTLSIVVGVYSVCVLPLSFVTCVDLSLMNRGQTSNSAPEWLDTIHFITTMMALLNSAVNPIIYHKRIPHFRLAFYALLHIKPRGIDSTSTSQFSSMQ